MDEAVKVSVTLGATLTRDFNSVRVDIGVTDAAREGESVDDCTNRIYAYVESKVEAKVVELRKALLD